MLILGEKSLQLFKEQKKFVYEAYMQLIPILYIEYNVEALL